LVLQEKYVTRKGVAALSKMVFSAILPGLLFIGSACSLGSHPKIRGDIEARECVVLLHGLARTSRSMRKMEKALLHAGYSTVNLGLTLNNHLLQM